MTIVGLSAITRDLSVAVVVGALLLLVTVVRGAAVERAALVARIGAIAWVISSAVFLVWSYAEIANVGVNDPTFGQQLWSFVADIDLGRAYGMGVAAALVTSIAVTFARSPSEAAWSFLPIIYGLGVQAETGHAAGADDHHLAVTAMFMHIAASAVWLGLLVGIAAVRRQLGRRCQVRRGAGLARWRCGRPWRSSPRARRMRGCASARSPTSSPPPTGGSWPSSSCSCRARSPWRRGIAASRCLASPRPTCGRASGESCRSTSASLSAVIAHRRRAVANGPHHPGRGGARPEPGVPPHRLPAAAAPRRDAVDRAVATRDHVGVRDRRPVGRVRAGGRFACADAATTGPGSAPSSFVVGMAGLVWITQGAPAVYGMVTFSGHMVEHMLLVMAVPLPIVWAAPVTLALRALPAAPRRHARPARVDQRSSSSRDGCGSWPTPWWPP